MLGQARKLEGSSNYYVREIKCAMILKYENLWDVVTKLVFSIRLSKGRKNTFVMFLTLAMAPFSSRLTLDLSTMSLSKFSCTSCSSIIFIHHWMEAIAWGLNIFCKIQQVVKISRTKDTFKLDFDSNSQKKNWVC